MTDTVTTKVVFSGTRRYTVNLTNLSDGTGESGVKKVDITTLLNSFNQVPTKLIVEKIKYDVASMRVLLQWNTQTPATICVLQGWGELNWQDAGGLANTATIGSGNESILLTTANQAAGDGYNITIYLRMT